MTNQSPITPDELSAKWSNLLNQAFIQIITLEKQLRAQADYIQKMTANEAVLVQNLQDLEDELIELKSSPPPLSPAQREIAAQGSAIIADGQ